MTKKIKVWIGLSITLLLVPALAMAAAPHGDAHHHPAGLSSLIWPAVNFFIYAYLMHHFYKKYGRPALLSRAATFEQHVKKAAQVLDDAERELRDIEERFQSISDEQSELRDRLAREGSQVAAQLVAQAEQNANGIRNDVSRRIERELAAATAEVREQAIRRATELARKKLSDTLSEEDDSRLRKDAVRGLFSIGS